MPYNLLNIRSWVIYTFPHMLADSTEMLPDSA